MTRKNPISNEQCIILGDPGVRFKRCAVQNLEAREMEMHRVRISSDVDDLPDLGVSHRRPLCLAARQA